MINLDNDLNKIIKEGRTKEEYIKDYNTILSNAKPRGIDRTKLEGYYEIHHDIPRSIRPDLIKEKSNLTALTAKEHIVCHILLYRIYPDDDKIIAAADCMLGCHFLCADTKEREEVIKNIDLGLISELREKVLRRLSKKVVAFIAKEDGTVVVAGELDSMREARDLGYLNINCAVKKHVKCGKYFWEYSDTFINLYPKEYSDYLDKVDSGLGSEIEQKPKTVSEEHKKKRKESHGSVICFDARTGEMVKIYESQMQTEADGFKVSAVNRSITRGTETRGYIFKFLSDVEQEEIERFKRLPNLPNLKLKTDEIVCYDLHSSRIHKIYPNLRKVADDGFVNTTICNVLKSNNKEYRGYRWEYLYNWNDEAALEDYRKFGGDPIIYNRLPSDPQKIIKCDLDCNILGMYENLHSVPGYDYRLLSVIINRENNVYTKDPQFRWFKYERFKSEYPEKLREYYERVESTIDTE